MRIVFKILSILSFLKSPFVIISLIALVWIIFFDTHNYLKLQELKVEREKLLEEKYYYKSQIIDINRKRNELLTDSTTKEKYAREHFFMKKDNEDVFICKD